MNTKDHWDHEYRKLNAIPSSTRTSPAHGLVKVKELCVIDEESKNILDLGCGNGRNAIYLSEFGFSVECIDYSNEALRIFKDKLSNEDNSRINILNADIGMGLPYSDKTFDCVLDSYFHCHFVNLDKWREVLLDICRVIKSGGKLISIQLSVNDDYYKRKVINEFDGGFVSHDDINGFEKIHFSESKYTQLLSDLGFRVTAHHIEFEDFVSGMPYLRKVVIYCAEKK